MADRTVKVILSAQINSYQQAMRQASRDAVQFGRDLNTGVVSGSKNAQRALDTMGKAGTVAGAALLGGFLVAGRAAMNFDQQMSAVAAATHATAGELDALRDAALDAGERTAFSATESAAAIENLAKAGVSTADILGGGLAGALDLAAAGGIGVAEAAELAAMAITQFGLSGSDMAHVADLLAAAAGKAQGEVTDIGMALRQAGLVAAQTGLSIDETTAALAAFAGAGLLGSDAGTSLKTMLQRLTPQSAEAAALMSELGFSAFDAAGNFVGLSELAGELQESFGSMTVEQRNLAMATIFGSDAVRAANVLFREGADGIESWEREVNDAGYAAETAAIRMDNLAGDIEEFSGALETALIEGGSTATGGLRFLTQSATEAVRTFSNLPAPVQFAGMAMAGIGGTALLGAGGIALVASKASEARAALEAMGASGQRVNTLMGRLGRVGGYAAGITATAGAIYLVSEAFESLLGLDPVTADIGELENALLDLADSGRITGELASIMGGDLDKLGQAVERLAAPSTLTQLDHFRGTVMGLGGLLGDPATDDLDQARQRIDDLDKALATLATRDPEAAARALQEITDALQDQGIPASRLTGLLDDYDSALASIDTQARTTAPALKELEDGFAGPGDAAEEAAEKIQNYIDALRSAADPMFAAVSANQANRDALLDLGDAQAEAIAAQEALNEAILSGNADEIADAQRDLEDAWRAVADAQVGAAESAIEADAAQRALAAAVNETPEMLDQVIRGLWEQVAAGRISAETARVMADELTGVAEAADEIHGPYIAEVEAETAAALAQIDHLDARLAQLTRPRRVAVQVFETRAAGGRGRAEFGLATGGLVPDLGFGPGDSVPALLTPGEFVLRKSAAQALGPDVLSKLNHFDRFQTGGPVGAGHAHASRRAQMLGNVSGTPVGQAIIAAAGPDGDPSGDLERLLDQYEELIDLLGVATADQILWSTQSLDGFELAAEGALEYRQALLDAADAAAAVAAEEERLAGVRFEFGDMSRDEYRAFWQARLDAAEEFSEEWAEAARNIARIDEEVAREREDAMERARRAVEEEQQRFQAVVDEYSSLYQRAVERHQRAVEDYADAVSERNRRIVEETARFRDDIVATFRGLVNPVDLFGGAQDVTAAGLTAALEHRMEAARRFAEVFPRLVARGVDQSVLTQLAQRGPEGLSLAEALLDVDPALVNQAMSQTAAFGSSVADIALGWESAAIQQRVYAEVALPAQRDLNDLLADELRLRDEQAELQAEAEAWGRRMAGEVFPALTQSIGAAADEMGRLLSASALLPAPASAGTSSTTLNVNMPINGAQAPEAVGAAVWRALERFVGDYDRFARAG